MTIQGLDAITWAMLLFFAFAMPLMGRADMRGLRRALEAGRQDARLDLYERAIMFQWGAALLMAALWWILDRPVEPIGVIPQFGTMQIIWSIVALAGTGVFVWQCLRTTTDPEGLAQVRGQLGDLEDISPHDAQELGRFSAASITAGICEEFLFRGLLMGMLAAAWGMAPAILVSSFVFGLGHAYQGLQGIGRTALLGLVFALVTWLTGSIYIGIVAHAAIDLAQGRMLHAAVSRDSLETSPVLDAA